MTKVRHVSAWVPPNSELDYSKKSDEMMLVFSIMDQVEREAKEAKEENPSNSHHIQNPRCKSKIIVFLIISNVPLKIFWHQTLKKRWKRLLKPWKRITPAMANYLTRKLLSEVCECGRMKLWTKSKTFDQGSQERLLKSPTKNTLIFNTPSTENRQDNLGCIIIIIASVFTILFLFFIRNIEMAM